MVDKQQPSPSEPRPSTSRRQDLTLCLIFILIGMGGVLFSTRWDDPVLRRITLLLSVALPVFGVGNFLARLHVTGLQKVLLLAGVLMLIVGGLATVADFPGTLIDSDEIPRQTRDFARWAGALGLVAGLVAILFAVVRSEEELTEIGDRFRYLTEHMSEGFTLSAPDGTILLVNRRFLEMTGFRQEDIVGHNALELVRELEHDTLLTHLELRKQQRATEYVIDYRVDNEERHFSVSGTPIFNRRGEHAGTVAIFRDVTEQVELSRSLEKYAEGLQRLVEEQTHQLRESEERLRGLLVHMNEGFLTLDAAFRVRFVNERVCELLNVEPGELVGRDVFEFVETAGRARLLNLLELAGSKQTKRLQLETNLTPHARGLVPVVLGVSRVEDSREGGARYSLVVTDVSKQKEMQRQLELRAIQLESANEELRILDRTKDSFLTNVTHELRTPLSTIRGYVEMLDTDCIAPLEGEHKSAVQVISRNVDRLGTLIEEMIEFSRMQMRGFRLNYTLFRLDELAEECVRSIRPTAAQREIALAYDLVESMPHVWGDRARLAQVLTNLLSNAVKFTDPQGKVELKMTRAPGGTACVSVSDTGIGISAEFHQRVFDKFFQIDNSLERRYEGAGIGLSIAKSIAEAHGGTIELASAPGKGSKFTLVLPGACFDESYSPGENGRIESRRIVCISEDMGLMSKLSGLIQAWSGRTECFSGGHEAIRACKQGLPDLIVTNETTDDITGPAFITLLQQTCGDDSTPIILMTDRDAPVEESFVDLSGRVEILEKPFQAHEFFWKIHRMLGNLQELSGPAQEERHFAVDTASDPVHVVVEPDADLLEWLHAALTNRGISAAYFGSPEEALARMEAHGAKTLILDTDGLSVEQSSRIARWIQGNHTPLCAITGLPDGEQPLNPVDAVLSKPFSVQDLLETLSQMETTLAAIPIGASGTGNQEEGQDPA